jgi:dihydrofolate reductase
MRKLAVLSFISLDGVMQGPGGPDEDTSGGFRHGGWTVPFSDESSGTMMRQQLSVPFDLLLGRKTYDIFAGYWPNQDPEGAVAKPFNAATKYVVSNSSPVLSWENSVLIDGDVATKIEELKQQDGPMLQVYGSGNLVQTLLKNDLVDELWLKIYPVTLGSGKRLFAEPIPATFELVESKTTPKGVIFVNYKRAGELVTGSFA